MNDCFHLHVAQPQQQTRRRAPLLLSIDGIGRWTVDPGMLECRGPRMDGRTSDFIDHAPHTIMQAASVMIFRVSDSVCVWASEWPLATQRRCRSVHPCTARAHVLTTHRPMPFQIQLRDEVAAISLMDSQTATNGDVVNWR